MKKLLIACLSLLLVACSSPKNETNEHIFKVAMECNYAPFNWTQVENTEYSMKISDVDYCDGYDVQIAKRLAEELNKELQIIKSDWDGLIPSLNNGDVDAIIAGMTNTPERRDAVDFTNPYYESEMVIIVRKDSSLTTISNIQELSGYKVLGQINTLYDTVIDQINGVIHAIPQESYPRMILSLTSGEVDAITAELPVAEGVVSANPELTIIKFTNENGFKADTTVSIAVKKGNTELLNKLNCALDKITNEERKAMMSAANMRQPAIEE